MGKGKRPVAVAAVGAALALAAVALAATPKAGPYKGSTSETPINGFKAPVSFTVPTGGHKITAFKWSGIGCFGAGGFGTSNPFGGKSDTYKVGKLSVSSSGSFSVSDVPSTYTNVQGYKTITTSSVSGKFNTKKAASGTITYSQHLTGPNNVNQKCGPGTLTFSVKRK
jgi:hypothetical protein